MSTGLCADCVKGNRLNGTPRGSMVETPALPAYFIPGNESYGATKTSKALVILPDAFGLALPNAKIIADILAKQTGMDVWAGDIFKGKPFCKEEDLAPYMPEEAGQQLPFTTKLGRIFSTVKLVATGLPSMIGFRPAVQDPWVVDFVGHIKKEYHYEKVGMIGYCWGGGIASRIAAMEGVIDSAMCVHVSGAYQAALPNARVPVAYFIAEEDSLWNADLAAEVERKWKEESERKYQFKVYAGTVHGFGCRPNLGIPKVKASWELAMEDIVFWIKETL
ncbi:dienelactone hydrolase endo-1-3,1,4-beta-D-glucanase [Serendipita vermifera]|nr:dienelactone hydrolase endo-1-3,1,4-beta-D-glucanase [Serendipita vermifera]